MLVKKFTKSVCIPTHSRTHTHSNTYTCTHTHTYTFRHTHTQSHLINITHIHRRVTSGHNLAFGVEFNAKQREGKQLFSLTEVTEKQ